MLGLVVLLGVFILLLSFFIRVRRPKNFPPGPRPWHILGNLLQLDPVNPLKDLERLKRCYGNVFSLYIGSWPAVVMNGLEAICEALVTRSENYAGRQNHNMISHIFEGKGIFMANYDSSWREHRRFTVTTLKNFGLGKQLKSSDGTSISMAHLDMAIFGHSSLQKHSKSFRLRGHLLYLTCLTLPLPFWNILTQHKGSRVAGEARDLIDCYLDQMDKAADGDSTFNDTQMGNLILELVMAGTDTISNTHRSAMLHLMTNQHVQDRCRKEIEEVLEGRTDVSFEDRHAMQYVQAVINEVQRIGYTIPLAAFHTTCKDTQLCGYQLPKGTMVIPNLSSVLHEEGQWKFPHEFNPENFLNDKGEFVKPEAFLPFSAGICVCLGEGLARMELFLFVVTLLQRFQFVWPETGGVPDLSLIFGTVCCLNPLHTL
uniref:Uncharacterized protein n=1 Tax=Esox lucius TaxID=8010 RepID=A0AAY5KTC6_ESOLU